MSEPYLRVHKINKTFKGVKALTDVDMEAHKSEVLGLAGINGAGKSTLMNVLAGIVIPEEGDIYPVSYTHLPSDGWTSTCTPIMKQIWRRAGSPGSGRRNSFRACG